MTAGRESVVSIEPRFGVTRPFPPDAVSCWKRRNLGPTGSSGCSRRSAGDEVSFFDEDDEPVRTTPRPRPRPRRGSPAGGAAADQQQIYMRRAVGGLLIVLIVVLLGVVVKSCSDSNAKRALTDYNTKVVSLQNESQDTSSQLFKLFGGSQPAAQQLQTSINGLIKQSNNTLSQAQNLSVPGAMVPAQQSFLIALQLRH